MRILLAEDDLPLGQSIRQGLEREHYAVDLVQDGEEALTLSRLVSYDLVILDVLLPYISGFEVCRQLRRQGPSVPILFLTALSDVESRVTGLDLGGDDYLIKPFAFRELEARVRALLRRDSPSKTVQLQFLDITLDPRTHEVRRNGNLLTLTAREYVLLEFLLRHPRQVLSRGMIAEHLWNAEAENLSNVIDVYVSSLRRKLCANGASNVLYAVRGFGYQLKEPAP